MAARHDLADLRLRDYVPEPAVRLAQHLPERASVPAVDVHNHLGRRHSGSWSCPDVAALLELMDECNLATIVNLDGDWADELEENLTRYDRAHPGRFVTFCRVDWSDCASSGWEKRLAASLRDSAARGAGGIKIWKDVGLRVRDENGELFFLDDARLEPLWEAIADSDIPVLVHTADPVAFFQPLDERNERVEELLAHPDWYFYGPEFPPFMQLMDALEHVVSAHPDITFIGAHVGCYAEDLEWVGRMLSMYPNFHVDIAARLAELGRQPRATRRLFLNHPTRILLGTDCFPPRKSDYMTYFRFLATDDEYFPYSDETPPGSGRWSIYAVDLPSDVLRLIEGDNARRLIPRAAGHG